VRENGLSESVRVGGPYVDGKPLKHGIGKLTLTADTSIEWKIEKTEKPVKPEKSAER
jgi:hypothetical protein